MRYFILSKKCACSPFPCLPLRGLLGPKSMVLSPSLLFFFILKTVHVSTISCPPFFFLPLDDTFFFFLFSSPPHCLCVPLTFPPRELPSIDSDIPPSPLVLLPNLLTNHQGILAFSLVDPPIGVGRYPQSSPPVAIGAPLWPPGDPLLVYSVFAFLDWLFLSAVFHIN